MNKGILIFAHNNGVVDYVKLATISAHYAKKFLNCPISLVTDSNTVSTTHISEVFDSIIIAESKLDNTRTLNGVNQHFVNDTRLKAWSLTPYDTTLIIDADYIVLSPKLSEYWNVDESFMMAEGVIDFLNIGQEQISKKTLPLKWATTIMFKKDDISKTVFSTAEHVKNNYKFYSDLYDFSTASYRNDYAFTIAEHIVYGLNQDKVSLPKVLFLNKQSDQLIHVSDDHIWFNYDNNAIKIKGSDIHILNKETVLENF